MKNYYVILAPSAYQMRDCLIGEGSSQAAAWNDAYGPECQGKKPKWARSAYCTTVSYEELEELRESAANA